MSNMTTTSVLIGIAAIGGLVFVPNQHQRRNRSWQWQQAWITCQCLDSSWCRHPSASCWT